jgi:hypothetical protein
MSDIDKDWCLNMAALEGDAEIGAGSLSEFGTCPAYGTQCEYVAKVEAQAAEIERLRYELRCIFSDYRGCMDHEWIADVLAALGETE